MGLVFTGSSIVTPSFQPAKTNRQFDVGRRVYVPPVTFLESVTDPEELAWLKEYVILLERLPDLEEKFERVRLARAQPRSELASDDAKTAWMHLSHYVTHSLALAHDSLRTLATATMADDGQPRLPQFAHYQLIRSALESSSHGIWLLAPDDQGERIRRLLISRLRDAQNDRGALRAMVEAVDLDDDGQVQADFDKQRAHIAHLATASGFSLMEIQKSEFSYAAIVREASKAIGVHGRSGESMWRMMSGFAHPSVNAMVRFANLREVGEAESGIVNTVITSSARMTVLALSVTIRHVEVAHQLFGSRKLRPAGLSAAS